MKLWRVRGYFSLEREGKMKYPSRLKSVVVNVNLNGAKILSF